MRDENAREREREREEIIPSPCWSERSERAVCQEWRQDFSFPPPGPRPLLFSYLASWSLSFSSPFSVFVPLRPLSYGYGYLSRRRTLGEKSRRSNSICSLLEEPFRPREQKLIISTKRYTPLTGCIPLVKNGNPRERRRGFRFLCSRRQFPSRLTN